ncbi:MAG TPA: Gfo/Idh/MocA family oxidoreductase [Steroidobacteraceae bacterium]|nr:Gfo/Idh/MocA family oxidoreductase [Steroidobacteraceae bacterium]
MTSPLAIAVVGLGKIAHDQHLPAIDASERFELVAGASPGAKLAAVPVFENVDELLASGLAIDAVALCQPPQLRFAAAAKAIHAGKHVLLEKPPGATVGEVELLAALAERAGTTLFAAWHSRFAPGVARAQDWLAQHPVQQVAIRWQEDVRVWHGGQQWIWHPGGLGVFDAGINALSIATQLLARPLRVQSGTLQFPANCGAPIAAELFLRSAGDVPVHAIFDWRTSGEPTWVIELQTAAGNVHLSHGGARLRIAARDCSVAAAREYPDLYERFARLIELRQSEVDVAPLRLIADAFLCCAIRTIEPFDDALDAGEVGR